MSQSNLPQKILVIDDDVAIVTNIAETLGKLGIKVEKASNLETAFYLFNQQRFDVALIEVEFAPLAGLALVQKWRKHDSLDRQSTAFIMMTGNKVDDYNSALIKELGDLETVSKPFTTVQILPFLARALATRKRLAAYLELKNKVLDYYLKTNDFDQAAAAVQKQLPVLGERGLSMLFELYEQGGKLNEALSTINKLLERDPKNIAMLNSKGRLLMRLERYQEAKEVFVKADEVAPLNIERINHLVTSYLQTKEPDQAVERMKEVTTLSPEQPDLKFEMFSKLYDHGYDEHAITFGKETAKPMEIVRFYNNKGVTLAKDGDLGKALTEYSRALRFYPKFRENYRIHFNIALANLQQKSINGCEVAIKHLKICVEMAPDFDKGQKALEQAEKMLERLRQTASGGSGQRAS